MRRFLFGLCSLALIGLPFLAQAAPDTTTNTDCSSTTPKDRVCLRNPLEGNPTEATDIIGRIIKVALGVVGSLALVILIRGGSTWLESNGNPEKVAEGAKAMLFAILGLLVIFVSYVLLPFVTAFLTGNV